METLLNTPYKEIQAVQKTLDKLYAYAGGLEGYKIFVAPDTDIAEFYRSFYNAGKFNLFGIPVEIHNCLPSKQIIIAKEVVI